MKVEFVGVGEAFDELLPNNSQIVEWQDCRLLIDCGYSIPQVLWKQHPDPDYLDAIYISHRHADHYFGLPSVLLRFAEDGRVKPLSIICQEHMKSILTEMIDYGYLGILPKLKYQIQFLEVSTGKTFSFRNASFDFAVSSHPVKNFSIAITYEQSKYAYSGDGNFNAMTRVLYNNSSLLVHEAYSLNAEAPGHAEIGRLLVMAREENVKMLALTHIQRNIRRNQMEQIQARMAESQLDVIIPAPGDVLEI
jgi:ribonuclease BN (tRNA processing enzyme)